MAKEIRKSGGCPKCFSKHIYASSVFNYGDEEGNGASYQPIWSCECCGSKFPRQLRKRRVNEITPAQKRAIERAKSFAISWYGNKETRTIVDEETFLKQDGEVRVTFRVVRTDCPQDSGLYLLDQKLCQFWVGRRGGFYGYGFKGSKCIRIEGEYAIIGFLKPTKRERRLSSGSSAAPTR
jgi:hypothetical protein